MISPAGLGAYAGAGLLLSWGWHRLLLRAGGRARARAARVILVMLVPMMLAWPVILATWLLGFGQKPRRVLSTAQARRCFRKHPRVVRALEAGAPKDHTNAS